jgi:fibronectin type 3 domain-containing protein
MKKYGLLVLLIILVGCIDPMGPNESIPEIPTNLDAKALSLTDIQIIWSSVSNADGYHIYKSKTSTGDFEEIGASTTRSYIDADLTPYTTHFYKVSAYNKHGESALSDYVSATATLIPAPTNVRVTEVKSSSINIEWDSVQNATGYKVYRTTSETDEFTLVNTLATSTDWTNFGLDVETTYYYRVKAYNSSSESDFSNIVSATTSMAVPAVPSNVNAVAESTSSITVSWDSVPNAEGYKVYRSKNTYGTYTLIETTEETSFTDTALEENTIYYYKITAYNAGGESTQSSYDFAKTRLAIPNQPAISSTTADQLYVISVRWSFDSRASGYYIYRSSTENGEYTRIGTASGSSTTLFRDLVGTPNTTYYYKVSAFNASGESEKSDFRLGTSMSTTQGLTWDTAIPMNPGTSTPASSFGYFQNGADVVWYSFARPYTTTTLYAEDSAFSSNYTGDIVIDLWYVDLFTGEAYSLALNGNPATDIDLGGGSNSNRNPTINWSALSYGTIYVSVRPKSNFSFYKGTFMLYHQR